MFYLGEDGGFLCVSDELVHFLGEDVDVAQAEHVHHEHEALLEGFLVEVLDL